jgi:hypothetical protein
MSKNAYKNDNFFTSFFTSFIWTVNDYTFIEFLFVK